MAIDTSVIVAYTGVTIAPLCHERLLAEPQRAPNHPHCWNAALPSPGRGMPPPHLPPPRPGLRAQSVENGRRKPGRPFTRGGWNFSLSCLPAHLNDQRGSIVDDFSGACSGASQTCSLLLRDQEERERSRQGHAWIGSLPFANMQALLCVVPVQCYR